MVHHIGARSAVCVVVERGTTLRIRDVAGQQVADVWAVARSDPSEVLSSGRTFDYNGTLQLTTAHVLYSNRSRAMFSILGDDVGRHDFLYAPCSQEMFERQYGLGDPQPNCLDNLARAMAPRVAGRDHIGTPFNVFMNVEHHRDGRLEVLTPRSRAGQSLTLRAELDLAVGVSACAAPRCNGGTCTSIELELLPDGSRDA